MGDLKPQGPATRGLELLCPCCGHRIVLPPLLALLLAEGADCICPLCAVEFHRTVVMKAAESGKESAN